MALTYKGIYRRLALVCSAAAVVVLIGGLSVAVAKPGKANPKGNPNCDGNTPITSPAKKCKGNNGFGNGGGDGTPNGKQDITR